MSDFYDPFCLNKKILGHEIKYVGYILYVNSEWRV